MVGLHAPASRMACMHGVLTSTCTQQAISTHNKVYSMNHHAYIMMFRLQQAGRVQVERVRIDQWHVG